MGSRRRALISVAVVFIGWEIIGRFIVANPLFFVPVSGILQAGARLASTGELWQDTYTSVVEAFLGFMVGLASGLLIGGLIGMSRPARDYIEPWISALYSTPVIALGPLFVLWFGLGVTSKVAVVAIMAILPVIINTEAGLRNTDTNLIEAIGSFGASRWQIFVKVRLPSSLPFIIAGARHGVARSLVGVFVAELFGARAGLGYRIFVSAQNFRTAELFVGVFMLAGLGILGVAGLKWAEKRLAPWRGEEAM